MKIWDCADGFVAEIENDDDFDAFLRAFTADDDVKHHCYDEDECFDYDDGDDDFDIVDDFSDYEVGYNPYMGCFDDDC